MFEYEGQQFTLDQVKEAAKKRNLSVEDYVSQFNIKKVEEPEQEAGKTQPQVTGAPVEETAAPDTVSKPEDTSLELQPVKPLKYIKKGVALTEGQLKATTGFGDDTDFGDSYIITGPNDYKEEFTKQELQDAASNYGMTAKQYLQRFVNNPNYGIQLIPGGETNLQELNEVIVYSDAPKYMKPLLNETKQDLLELNVQRDQKYNELVELGYSKQDANSEADQFKQNRLEEILQLKLRKVDNDRDRQVLMNLLKKPEDFSYEEINKGLSMMSENINIEIESKSDGYKMFLNTFDQVQVELNSLKTKIEKETDVAQKNVMIEQYNKKLSDISGNLEYWSAWSGNITKAIENYNKALDTYNDLVAVKAFNNTLDAQAAKDFSIKSRINYSVESFIGDVYNALTFGADDQDEKRVLKRQKYIDTLRDRLPKAMSYDDSRSEGLFLRSLLESGADNAASSVGSVLLYTVPGAQIVVPVLFGLSATGQRRSSLLQQKEIADLRIANLEKQYSRAAGKAKENLLKQIEATKKIDELTNSDVYMTSLVSGVIEGGITYLAGKLGTKGINAIPGLEGALTKSPFLTNMLAKSRIASPLTKITTGFARVGATELAEESTIAGLNNEIVDGVILGNRLKLSEVYTPEFVRDVLTSTFGVSGGTTTFNLTSKLPLIYDNYQLKNEKKKTLSEILKIKDQLEALPNKYEEGSKEFENEQMRLVEEVAKLSNKLDIDAQDAMVGLENLTKEELNTLLEKQAEKAKARNKALELAAEARKIGDKVDGKAIELLQKKYDEADAAIAEITNLLSPEQRKTLSLEEQFLTTKFYKNLSLASLKGDTFSFGESALEIGLLAELDALNKNEKGLSPEELSAKKAEISETFAEVLKLNSSFNKLSKDKQDSVLEYIKNNEDAAVEMATTNGQYLPGRKVQYVNSAIVQATLADKNISFLDKAIAVTAPKHETLHAYTDHKKLSEDQLKRAGEELKLKLENKYDKLSDEDVKILKDRIKRYEEGAATKKDYYEELMNLYYELNDIGIINDSEIDNAFSLNALLKNVRSTVYGSFNNAGSLNENAFDAISHLRSFNKFLESKNNIKDLAAKVKEETKDPDNIPQPQSSLSAENRKDMKVAFDKIILNEDGTQKYANKKEFQENGGADAARVLISNTNILDGSIRNMATRYGAKSVDVKAVKDIVADRVAKNFDPQLNDSLFGYILGARPILNFAYRDYAQQQANQVDAGSLDVEAGETGYMGQAFSEEDYDYDDFESMDLSIGTRKQEKVESQLINPAETLGTDAVQFISEVAQEVLEQINLEETSIKTTPVEQRLINYMAEKIGVRENTIRVQKDNLNSGEVQRVGAWIYENADTLIKLFPDAFVEEGVSEKYVGTATGVPNNLLNAFYINTKKEDPGPDSRIGKNGLYPFILKAEYQKVGKVGAVIPQELKESFLDVFGINPDGSITTPGLNRTPKGQAMKGIMALTLRLATNTAIRQAAQAKGIYDGITLEDVGAGKSYAMASRAATDVELNKVYTAFKDILVKNANKNLEILNAHPLFVKKGIKLTKEDYNQIINKGSVTDPNLGPRVLIAENLNNVKLRSYELAEMFPTDIFNEGTILAILGHHYRETLLDYDKVEDLSDAANKTRSIIENGKVVESVDRANELKATKADVYYYISQDNSSSYSQNTKDLLKQYRRFYKAGNHFNSGTATKWLNEPARVSRSRSAAEVLRNDQRRLQLEIHDAIISDYINSKIEFGKKQEIIDALAYVVHLGRSTTNIVNGRRSLVDFDPNSSVFDDKATSYTVEHLDANVFTSTQFIENVFRGKTDKYDFPRVGVLPVYKISDMSKSDIAKLKENMKYFDSKFVLENNLTSKGVFNTRTYLDRIKGYKFGTDLQKIKEINKLRQVLEFDDLFDNPEDRALSSYNTSVDMNWDIVQEEELGIYNARTSFNHRGSLFEIEINGAPPSEFGPFEGTFGIEFGTFEKDPKTIEISFAEVIERFDEEDGTFDVTYTYNITGKGKEGKVNPYEVLSIIINGVVDRIKKEGVRVVTFSSKERSRQSLYDAIARRFAKKLGWSTYTYEGERPGVRRDIVFNPEEVINMSELSQADFNELTGLDTKKTKDVISQEEFNKRALSSLNSAVKIDLVDESDELNQALDIDSGIQMRGSFKLGGIEYGIFISNEESPFGYEFEQIEKRLGLGVGNISDNESIVELAFSKKVFDKERGMTRGITSITGDSAKSKINQFTVFATVANAAIKAIKSKNISGFYFTSNEDSRSNLYYSLSKFFAEQLGWNTTSRYYTDEATLHFVYDPKVLLKNSTLTEKEKTSWQVRGYETKAERKERVKKYGSYYSSLSSVAADVSLENRFAAMIAAKDARITPGQKLDLATARNLAAQRKKRFDVITPGANDFDGLMYALLAKGELGEEQYQWITENLYKPYGKAHYRLNSTRQRVARSYKKIEKENKQLFKKLKEDSGFGGFTFEQALRVWMFSKIGKTPSGVDEDTQKALVAIVKNNPDIEKLGYDLSNILPMTEFWIDPDAETWQIDTLKSDVINAIEKVTRKQYLAEWKQNVDEIFSQNNMNKLVAAFGEDYVAALKDILYRMETGSSRPEGSNKQMNMFMNWIRGSVATTMFFNRRSFVLQQISNVNFLNWADNNPIAAAKAFANQKQYWTDFAFILNSDYLKERRGGLKTDVNAADLAEAAKKGGYKGVLNKILQAGFSLTQLGDSLAIATGGSTFYRNRVNTYLKQGLSQEQAEQKAFLDFQEISEETQQSARPDRLSQQQTNSIGRVFLAFQNTPMQMTRLSVKAGKDMLAGRGNRFHNGFKMLYYGAIQSAIFSMLQTALIGDMFNLFEEDEDDSLEEKKAKKTKRVINGIVDSFLKGTGMYGVGVATAKNAIIKFMEQEERKEKGKRPDYAYVVLEALNFSPPVGIKARNFYGALKNYEYNAKYVEAAGFDLNNPAVDIASGALDVLFNIPTMSTVTTLRDIDAAITGDYETMTRMALLSGWHTWDLGLEDDELNKIKAQVKEVNKKLRGTSRGSTSRGATRGLTRN